MTDPIGTTEHSIADEEYAMPSAEALLASTLALMTGYVQGCCDDHRGLMAQKIVHHLVSLSQLPTLSSEFKAMLWNLHTRWLQQSHAPGIEAAFDPAEPAVRMLWHKTHGVVQ